LFSDVTIGYILEKHLLIYQSSLAWSLSNRERELLLRNIKRLPSAAHLLTEMYCQIHRR
jgi:hypothetical protein